MMFWYLREGSCLNRGLSQMTQIFLGAALVALSIMETAAVELSFTEIALTRMEFNSPS